MLGFLALSLQVILLREFFVHFSGNEITYGVLLACWLLWGAIGSLTASRIKFKEPWLFRFYYAAIAIYPLCLLTLRFSRFILKTLPGEPTGFTTIIAFSLILSFFSSFPLGMLFVFNVHFLKGNLSHVYFLESIGSASAGLMIYFLFIPFFSNWQMTVIIELLVAVFLFHTLRHKRQFPLFLVLIIGLFCFWTSDKPSQNKYWEPFRLVDSKDTPHGKLQVIKIFEQTSFYNNSAHVFSSPNIAASEESVHFALLQNPYSKNVLLIGGSAGSLEQMFKYSVEQVDYVELDPEIIHLSRKHLTDKEKTVLDNPRVHIHYQDGRRFLKKTSLQYDAIILHLPDPISSQINRFYSKEFFLEAKEKLTAKGIFSFCVSSAENYISPQLQDYLSSLYFTLKEAFSDVEIVPGNTNIFLASSDLEPLNFKAIAKKIKNLNLNNVYISPQLLVSRLDSSRIEQLRKRVHSGKGVINSDFRPISYFFNAALWSNELKSFERKVFSWLSHRNLFWLLDLPLLIGLFLFLWLGWKGKRTSLFLAPLFLLGLSSIILEIIVLLTFQARYGFLYQSLSLLFASFMFGLSLGAYYGSKKGIIAFSHILFLQLSLICLTSLLFISFQLRPPQIFFFFVLLVLGFLGGDLFIVSNRLFLRIKTNYGLGYGLELMGSFVGALVVSSLLIPLAGLVLIVKYLMLANSFCFFYMFWGWKRA